MSDNIIDDFTTEVDKDSEVEEASEEKGKPTEIEDFDVDDFTQFMEGVSEPEVSFDKYIPRTAKVTKKVNGQKRKMVEIDGELYPYFYRGLINDLHRGDAPIVFVHGKRRSGKSIVLSRIMYDLSDEIGALAGSFNPEEQICYGVKPFLNFYVNNVRRGLVLEEAGQNLNSKEWYSAFNRSAYDAFEVLGVMNLMTILASTDHGDIDNGVTKRDKYKLTCVDRKKHVFKAEKFEYKPGTETKELKDDFPKEICRFTVEIPPDEVMYKYRKKELDHKYTSIKDRIEELNEEEKDDEDMFAEKFSD